MAEPGKKEKVLVMQSKGSQAGKIKRWLKNHLLLQYDEEGGLTVASWFPLRIRMSLFYDIFLAAGRKIRNNKIVFENFYGRGYCCNPKYITEKLMEKYPGKFELVWLVEKDYMQNNEFPSSVRIVPYRSLRALKEHVTAKFWVSNLNKDFFIKLGLHKRKGQVYINTWHGSLGIKSPSITNENKNCLPMAALNGRFVDYCICNNAFEPMVYKTVFPTVREQAFLFYGHPRNDLFFNPTAMNAVCRKVRRRFNLGEKKILLYAPTFREDLRLKPYDVDLKALQVHLGGRFGGEWAVLVRLHPRLEGQAHITLAGAEGIFDATSYVDVQELLAAADCMLTDYSSCIFDFMLTRRPGFLYASDLELYDQERGFYYPIETTPFPLAENNFQLMQAVDDFDEAGYLEKVEKFLQDKSCIEDGHASERAADLIAQLAGIL